MSSESTSLSFGVIYNPPAATRCALYPKCAQRGYLMDTTLLACKTLNLNCTFSWFHSDEYGDADDRGVGTGLVGAIQNGQFDTSLPIFTPTYSRFKAITFSEFYRSSDVILMTRAPVQLSGQLNWNLLTGFNISVWLIFWIAFGLSAASLRLTLRGSRSPTTHRATFLEVCLSLITIDFYHPLLDRLSVRVVSASYFLAALVFSSSYAGVLFSQNMSFKRDVPFIDLESFVQCLERGQCRMISQTLSVSYIQLLMASESPLGARIRASIAKNPVLIVPIDDIPRTMLNEQSQFLVNIRQKNAMLSIQNRDCKFYTVSAGMSEYNSFPVARNSTKLKLLNKIAGVLRDYGLDLASTKPYGATSQCVEDWTRGSQRSSSLMLMSMATAFLFYALGATVGLCGFGCELVWDHWARRLVREVLRKVTARYKQGDKVGDMENQGV